MAAGESSPWRPCELPATGPAHPTRVEIRFEQVADGTVVAVTHSPTGASEPLCEGRVHRYVAAWPRVLAALEVAAGRAGDIDR